ncbi:MAG: flagellar biosynthesis protein FliQ [bacterium]
MDADTVIEIGQQALFAAAATAAPVLLTALGIGLVIGMLQAATQIQEMTLSFIPKLLGMVLAITIFGTYMLDTLVTFTTNIISQIPSLIAG